MKKKLDSYQFLLLYLDVIKKEKNMNKENKIKNVEALGNLMGGIKENYKNWGSDID